MKLVVKLSGHVLWGPRPEERCHLLRALVDEVREVVSSGHQVALVTGGGPPAREYIELCRGLGLSEGTCDLIGIRFSRLHAEILVHLLRDLTYPRVPENLEEVLEILSLKPVVVVGGLQPGQSTTAVATLIAEVWPADLLLITTDVEGVYTADPRRDPTAKLLPEVDLTTLEKILETTAQVAGAYQLLDRVSLEVLKRSRGRFRVLVTKLRPGVLRSAVRGEVQGTWVRT